ncbi:MAG: transcription antitermination factor NusB [Verrucomicrobia bacterium]|nr:transcription antitermination factor NusB [Verrucomicrobiota bacterium]
METQALQPQKFRELVLQVLFSHDVHASDAQELCTLLSLELKVTKRHVKDALAKVEAIKNSLPEIDAVIHEYSTSYAIDRIQSVERAILRLALYELLFEKAVPHQIIISEAKRLAKKFATPDAAVFCQALLDGVYKAKCSS